LPLGNECGGDHGLTHAGRRYQDTHFVSLESFECLDLQLCEFSVKRRVERLAVDTKIFGAKVNSVALGQRLEVAQAVPRQGDVLLQILGAANDPRRIPR
jgi:hypothetical protein